MQNTPQAKSEKLLLDKFEAAELLGCSSHHVRNLVARKLLPCVRLGGLMRFRRSDLEKAIERLTETAF